MLILLCGMAASGKDAIEKVMLQESSYKSIKSTTSRPKREGETDGVEYNFITKEQFLEDIDKDLFLEYRAYDTNVNNVPDTWYYGTKKFEVNSTDKYIVIKDLKGCEKLKQYYESKGGICKIFYIYAPDDIRTERAKNRGSFDLTEWTRRLAADKVDFSNSDVDRICDYKIKNDGSKTLESICNYILTTVERF